MKRKYQPFIVKLCNDVFEELKGDIQSIEENKNALCDLLTQKFIDGKLSEDDEEIFDSEEEIESFLRLCWVNENMIHLQELGLVGTYDDGETFFITEEGKLYIDQSLSHF